MTAIDRAGMGNKNAVTATTTEALFLINSVLNFPTISMFQNKSRTHLGAPLQIIKTLFVEVHDGG